ncbi:MAG: acetylglutamate kinase [Alphaproteobacteria bacterium]
MVQIENNWTEKAQILSEALPYMRRYHNSTFVVKYGGHAMGDAKAAKRFAQDVVLLKQVGIHPVVVHGGGPQIAQMLQRLNIPSKFIDGLRVTDAATMEVVEMVLCGLINKQLVAEINAAGGKAMGLSGKDANLMIARPVMKTRINPETGSQETIDLGLVGEPHEIQADIVRKFAESEIIPVIAPIGVGRGGETYNINADTVAGAMAAALKATRLLLLTDVVGVLDADKNLIPSMTAEMARKLIANGVISGGMIPKVETCLAAVDQGVEASVILDGRTPHAILLEIFTPGGIGTLIGEDTPILCN